MKKCYRLSHLADHGLGEFLADAFRHECGASAVTLSALAEFDLRRLYRPAGFPSMFKYCVHELHMSEDTALKRIRVARTAVQFPAIFPALADGRVDLSTVLLLKPHLNLENADALLAAAAHKTNCEVEILLAERFPRPDVPTRVEAIAPSGTALAARPVEAPVLELAARPFDAPAPEVAVRPVESGNSRACFAPLSPGRFALQVTVDAETHEQLHYAQSLLGGAAPSGDVATVLKRALGALVRDLEKQKFGSGARTRSRRGSANPRYVPANVRRTVWRRDGGRCTFVSPSGRRCEEHSLLEFDHIEPLARGGRTVASNLRLRCRAHNQFEAERAFGAEFMREKRNQVRARAAQAKARSRAHAQAHAEEKARAEAARAAAAEVTPVLRQLGFKAEEARRGAAHAAHLAGAPLEQRLRVALQNLAPPCLRVPAPGARSAALCLPEV